MRHGCQLFTSEPCFSSVQCTSAQVSRTCVVTRRWRPTSNERGSVAGGAVTWRPMPIVPLAVKSAALANGCSTNRQPNSHIVFTTSTRLIKGCCALCDLKNIWREQWQLVARVQIALQSCLRVATEVDADAAGGSVQLQPQQLAQRHTLCWGIHRLLSTVKGCYRGNRLCSVPS